MAGGSKGKDVTTTAVSEVGPPGYAKPYVEQLLEGSKLRYEGDAPQFFPEATYVPFSSETETGLAGITGKALAGSPINRAGEQEYLDTLQGKYLDPTTNPSFSKMAEGVKARVLPQLEGRYIQAGRTGSGLHGRAVGEGVGQAIGDIAYRDYATERGRQADFARGAPDFAARRFDDDARLLTTGAAREAKAGDVLQDTMARYDFAQYQPQRKLEEFGGNIGRGIYGSSGTSTQTTPFFKGGSAASGALGGAMAGASTGAMFGPYGAAIGGVGGAALGASGSK